MLSYLILSNCINLVFYTDLTDANFDLYSVKMTICLLKYHKNRLAFKVLPPDPSL